MDHIEWVLWGPGGVPVAEQTRSLFFCPGEQNGAVEGDHRLDKEPRNKNAVGALDKNGLSKNKKAIAEDSIGARADEPKYETQLAAKRSRDEDDV
jgi:hypothetical protein